MEVYLNSLKKEKKNILYNEIEADLKHLFRVV